MAVWYMCTLTVSQNSSLVPFIKPNFFFFFPVSLVRLVSVADLTRNLFVSLAIFLSSVGLKGDSEVGKDFALQLLVDDSGGGKKKSDLPQNRFINRVYYLGNISYLMLSNNTLLLCLIFYNCFCPNKQAKQYLHNM